MSPIRLPARGIEQARLAELLDAAGCPLCRRARDAEARMLASIVNERATDVAFQRDLAERRGLCSTHAASLVEVNRREKGGTLAAAILHGAVLAGRIAELDEARRHRGGARDKRLKAAGSASNCPVCAHGRDAVTDAVAGLIDAIADPAWADALADRPICLDHLVRLMLAGSSVPSWTAVEERQIARVRAVRAALAGYVHHSSHDRRHLLTDEKRRAVVDATALLE